MLFHVASYCDIETRTEPIHRFIEASDEMDLHMHMLREAQKSNPEAEYRKAAGLFHTCGRTTHHNDYDFYTVSEIEFERTPSMLNK